MPETRKDENQTAELAPVPEHIEQESLQALNIHQGRLEELSVQGEKAVEAYLENRQKWLSHMQTVAIKESHPYHWTKYRDRDGKVICVVRDQGCVEIRKWLGVSITNYNPKTPSGTVEPKVSKDPDNPGVTVVEMWADGRCNLTGEQIEQVYYAARTDDDFIGRKGRLQDLKASCRTGLDSKITRILSGLRKVPEEILQKHGVNTDQSYKGHGYGSGADREASKVAEPGVKEKAIDLGKEVLSRTGGDKEAAKDLLKEITTSPDGKFKGFHSVDRITKSWQVDNAWKALKAHPIFGDQPEPGANDDVQGKRPF